MSEIYSIAVVCVPSDRLITDENGEQFYECMTQEELERIAREKDTLYPRSFLNHDNISSAFVEELLKLEY